jgi:hypothetical protein
MINEEAVKTAVRESAEEFRKEWERWLLARPLEHHLPSELRFDWVNRSSTLWERATKKLTEQKIGFWGKELTEEIENEIARQIKKEPSTREGDIRTLCLAIRNRNRPATQQLLERLVTLGWPEGEKLGKEFELIESLEDGEPRRFMRKLMPAFLPRCKAKLLGHLLKICKDQPLRPAIEQELKQRMQGELRPKGGGLEI